MQAVKIAVIGERYLACSFKQRLECTGTVIPVVKDILTWKVGMSEKANVYASGAVCLPVCPTHGWAVCQSCEFSPTG